MTEVYPQSATFVGDLYYLKDGVSVQIGDVIVKTGNTYNGKAEVDKMSSSYDPSAVIGISQNKIASDYPHREINVLVHGASWVKAAKNITAGDKLMGASNRITDLFSGNNTAQQTVYLTNVPVDSVVSVKETSAPTTLTRVYTTPTTNQYYLDDDTGKLIIGGTSVSGTNNYEVIYNIDSGRMEPLVEWVEETLTTSSHVATLSYVPEYIEYVEAATGTVTGGCKIITAGTVATKEAKLNRTSKTLTFFATDAVLTAKVRYKINGRSNCINVKALETKTAGEKVRVFVL